MTGDAHCGKSARPRPAERRHKKKSFPGGPRSSGDSRSRVREPVARLSCRVPSSPGLLEPVWEAQPQYLPRSEKASTALSTPSTNPHASCRLSVVRLVAGVAAEYDVPPPLFARLREIACGNAPRATPRVVAPPPSPASSTARGPAAPGLRGRWAPATSVPRRQEAFARDNPSPSRTMPTSSHISDCTASRDGTPVSATVGSLSSTRVRPSPARSRPVIRSFAARLAARRPPSPAASSTPAGSRRGRPCRRTRRTRTARAASSHPRRSSGCRPSYSAPPATRGSARA